MVRLLIGQFAPPNMLELRVEGLQVLVMPDPRHEFVGIWRQTPAEEYLVEVTLPAGLLTPGKASIALRLAPLPGLDRSLWVWAHGVELDLGP